MSCHAMPRHAASCRVAPGHARPMSCRRSTILSRFRPSSRLRSQSSGSVLIGGWQERASGPVFPRSLPPPLSVSLSLYPSVSSSPSSFSFSTVFFLLRSIFLSSETLSASSLCLCPPPVPPLFPSFMERRCLHPSISKRETRRSVLLVATLVAVRVDYHFYTVAGSPFFPSFGGKYLCRCIVSRDLPLFPPIGIPAAGITVNRVP